MLATSPMRRRGLTLIEVLVVIAIIGLLIALLIPATQSARRSAARAQCENNLRQIGIAIGQYEGVHAQLPPGRLAIGPGPDDIFCRSVFVAILPYLEGGPLYQSFNLALPITSLANLTAEISRPGFLVCPSDPEAAPLVSAGPKARFPAPDPPGGTYPTALTSYGFLYGTVSYDWGARDDPTFDPRGQINGSFNDLPRLSTSSITDGLSNTAFASERAVGVASQGLENPVGVWTAGQGPSTLLFAMYPPNDRLKNPPRPPFLGENIDSIWSNHPGGTNVLFGDASVRFVKETVNSWPINPTSGKPGQSYRDLNGFANLPSSGVWQALTTRAGGEIVSSGDY